MPKKAKKRANRSKKQSWNASKAKRDKSQKKQDQHVRGKEVPAAGPALKTTRGETRPECPLPTSRSSASARCTTESISVAGAASSPTSSKLVSCTKDPGWELPTCGLLNLGNTCFLNSVLQNMFKTRLLLQALLGDASGREKYAFVGPVTKALRKAFLDIIGKGPTASKRGAYSPKALLAAIQKAHPLFKGSHQQDAHELLMHLLGTLEDENLAACSDAGLSSDDGETTGASDQDDDVNDSAFVESLREKNGCEKGFPVALQPKPLLPTTLARRSTAVSTGSRDAVSAGGDLEHARAPLRSLDRTAIMEVFGGMMCSVVTCSTCAARSFNTEPTICLSLQIPQKKFVSEEGRQAEKAAAVETAKRPSKPVAAHLGGAQLSAKERRKASRQERERQKAKGKDNCTQAPVAIEKELDGRDYGGRAGTGADTGGDIEAIKADARVNGERVGMRPSLDSLNGNGVVGATQSEIFGIETGGARVCASSGSHDGCVTDNDDFGKPFDDGDSRADTPSSTASASSWMSDLSMPPAGVDNGARSPPPPPGDQATAQCGGVNLHDGEGGMDPEGTLGRKGSDSSDAVLVDGETDESSKSENEEGESAADVSDVAPTALDTFACVKNPLNRLVEPPAQATKAQGRDSLAISMYDCLDHFMAEEALFTVDGNGFNCEACCTRRVSSQGMKNEGGGEESRQDARKRLLMLGTPPGVLVCHLKRLQATKKTCRRVEFDLDLDMSPYFWQDSQAPLSPEETRYRLFGLVQHRGSCLGGHYVAYVQDKDGWQYASDTTVRPATLQEVKNCEAYMLFYERCDTPSCSIR